MSEEYRKLLNTPEWKAKRKEILERDNYTCQGCNGERSPALEVHHIYYKWGKLPWEYPNSSLKTLCRDCHCDETTFLNDEKKDLLDALSRKGFFAHHFKFLAVLVDGCEDDGFFEELYSFVEKMKRKNNEKCSRCGATNTTFRLSPAENIGSVLLTCIDCCEGK